MASVFGYRDYRKKKKNIRDNFREYVTEYGTFTVLVII